MHSVIARSAATVVGVALVLTACSDAGSGPAGDAQVSLNLATRAATAAASSAALSAPETYTDAAGNTLEIDRVQLVLREVELENETHQSACEAASASEGDCAEIELGPFLVDLPLGVGGAARTVTANVPAGTYDEVKFKIREPDDDTDADKAFVAAHPDFAHTSVKVEGSFNGTPFTFVSDLQAELKLELSPPLVVDGSGTTDLTLFADLGTWFRDAGGNLLDPSSVSGQTVADNIAGGFHAFEDENHDGSDDHGGDNGGTDDNSSGGQGADDGAVGI
ncbi:MAG TPA: hypothetical protein VFJ92_04795 [Gemmatimonadales bacterium]|jgi:hypothetical protein|nr:hypothetical protein [Gemmatimonadales bacterium]